MWIDITDKEKKEYNNLVFHPLQSYEWGEFRIKTGVKVIRRGYLENGKLTEGFTLTIHKVPKIKFNIGYLPKGYLPSKNLIDELKKIGKENNCIFIQLEPNVIKNSQLTILNSQFVKPSHHPLFTKYTFVLDISKSEEELLKNFHPKTRYNIKVAQKHGVKITEDDSEKAFNEYLRLTGETTKRQNFFAHTPTYHKKMWETLALQNSKFKIQNSYNNLSAHLLTARYKPEGKVEKILAAWILFVFNDTLYYPYGSSSTEFRNVMASNLIMWEAIKFGKKLGLKKFDMWGALEKEPNKNDPWYGFHKFKEGYGADHVEFVGSYDLVINPTFYQIYKIADKARWMLLKIKRKI